jgi:23S rRNA pseudouridine2605 synthase
MRINKYVAQATGLSRRAADEAIANGRVSVNGQPPSSGQDITSADQVTLDNQPIRATAKFTTILLNKPVGYVVSRDGQGSQTVYDLLPPELHHLKPVGRLDKDSSGLLLLTDDGELANQLTHPRYQKEKVYQIELDKPLAAPDQLQVEKGVGLEDGSSHLRLAGQGKQWTVRMSEGRNRQIRRTFAALGYRVTRLDRVAFGEYEIARLTPGKYRQVNN